MKKNIFKISFILLIFILLILFTINFLKNINTLLIIKKEYSRNIHYLNNLPHYKKRLNEIEQKIKNEPKNIFHNITHLFLLNQCTQFADKLKIGITSYNPVNTLTKKDKEYHEVSIEINVKTDFISILKFLNKIERADFITRINRLEINRKEPFSSDVKSKIIITGFNINEKQ